MPSLLTKIMLFLSAYSPLLGIFTIQYYKVYSIWILIPFLIGVGSVIWLLIFIRWAGNSAKRQIVVESIQRKDAEVIAYLFTYVLPFLGIKLEEPSTILSLSIFFFILLVINVSSNMIHINPVLNLLGYHVYEVSSNGNLIQTLLSKRNRLVRGTKLDVVLIGDDLLMEK
jgi:hypothetical protein